MRGAAALGVAIVLTFAGQAAAEVTHGMQEARERFDRGIDLFGRGDLEAALAEFERAYEIAPNSAVLYNIGTVQSRLRHYAEAVTSLERYLEEGGQSVPQDRRAEVEHELERLRSLVGRVVVLVRPVNHAEVFVDGTQVGRMPISSPLAVSAGQHEIEVRANGFLPYRRDVRVAGGAEVRVAANLTRAAPPGAILILTSVPYATVSIDGDEVGTTPLEEPVTVPVGEHTVQVSRPGYTQARATVEVRQGEVARFEPELSLLPDLPPELSGELDVRVNERRGVRFLLDGAPMPEGAVPVGPHRLEVRLEGFEPWVGEVNVERGQPTQLAVDLTPTENYREAYERSARSMRVASYAGFGAGGALLLVGLALELWNTLGRGDDWQAEDDFLQAQYRLDVGDPGRLPRDILLSRQDANDDLANGISGLRVGDCVMMALGGAALIAGVLLLVLGPDPGRFERSAVRWSPGGLAMVW